MTPEEELAIKSKRKIEWIKVVFYSFVAVLLVMIGNARIANNSAKLPEFEDLIHVEGEIASSEKVVSSHSSYLKICFKDIKDCYEYSSSLPNWRNAQKMLLKGNRVEIWAWGGNPAFIWQFKYNNKEIESYKLVKWQINNVRKFQLPLSYGIVILGLLFALFELRRVYFLFFHKKGL